MTAIPLDWPPTLGSYKTDLKLDADDDRYDDQLQATLDAAVAHVERVRSDVNFAADPDATGPAVTMDLIIGTLRLARRWDLRRDTPLAVLIAAGVGTTGIASWDVDVERLLRTGRYARIRFA